MLLVLSDSALPLGSFAFSNGLESFIAHRKPQSVGPAEVQKFVELSLVSTASATLPYVLAAYRHPEGILDLDNEFDASTLCHVTRRASIAQGRALMGVWERSLTESVRSSKCTGTDQCHEALKNFGSALRGVSHSTFKNTARPSGHFPPLWGSICAATSIPETSAAYIYLFKHAQTLLSAAVRASAIGPYQAQALLASTWLQMEIQEALRTNWDVRVQDAAQVVPIMDFWIALHDRLYTKIFNS